ncbi:hypothetical protein GE061_012009, partial [Apolygus lucorum]
SFHITEQPEGDQNICLLITKINQAIGGSDFMESGSWT